MPCMTAPRRSALTWTPTRSASASNTSSAWASEDTMNEKIPGNQAVNQIAGHAYNSPLQGQCLGETAAPSDWQKNAWRKQAREQAICMARDMLVGRVEFHE